MTIPEHTAHSPVDMDGKQPEHRLATVSCLVDDDLSAEAMDQLLSDWQDDGECERAWHAYHLIGDALRAGGALACSAQATTKHGSAAFARQVMVAAQASGSQMSSVDRLTVLASEAVPAANDSVFRWKMVAGLATMATVLSIAWGVDGQGRVQEAVLANGPAAVVTASSGVALSPVLVTTPQGPVLRDARLEELMHAHRQTSGASALQVPAGFLRSATFDASQR